MKITSKGQVTIPQHIRERCGLAPGTEIEFVLDDCEVVLKRIDEKKDSIRKWLDRVTGNWHEWNDDR